MSKYPKCLVKSKAYLCRLKIEKKLNVGKAKDEDETVLKNEICIYLF